MNVKMLFSKKLISIALAISIFFSFSLTAFADSNNAAGSSLDVPAAELLDTDNRNPEILNLAKTLQATSATTYDLDDIYNIIDECANALVEYDGSEFVSVTEYVHACLTGIASGLFNGSSSNPYLGTINSNIASIQAAVYGPAWDGSGVTNSLWNALQTIYSVNHADQLAQMAKQQGIIDALVGNTQYSLSNKLTNFQNDFNNITWLNLSSTFTFTSNSPINANTDIRVDVTGVNSNSQSSIIRIRLPLIPSNYGKLINFRLAFDNNEALYITSQGRFYTDIYVYGVTNIYPNFTFYVKFNTPVLNYVNFNNGYPASLSYLPIDSQDYFTLAEYITTSHIDNDLHTLSGGIDKLVQMYASDDELAAKQAQQQYESEALSDFTGGGSASASSTDRNDLKSISNTTKSGFDGGGSISNGLSVFNSNNSIWGWFSQDNANYFTPIQENRTKSSKKGGLIYDIPDYLSQSDNYLIDNLGDNNGQSYR